MAQEHAVAVGPFRLEMPPGRLWHGAQGLALLAEASGQTGQPEAELTQPWLRP